MINKKELLTNVIAMTAVFTVAAGVLFGLTEAKKRNAWNETPIEEMVDNEDEYVKLSYYYLSSSIPKDLATVNNALNKLLRKKINCEVKLKPIMQADYDSTVSLMINSADEFDICFTSNWALDYYQNAKSGAFYDLSNLLDEYAKTVKRDVDESLMAAATIDGHLYAIPNTQIIPRTAGLTFNKKWYDSFMNDNPTYKFDSLESLETYFQYCITNGADQTNMCEGFYPQGLLVYFNYDDMGGFSSPGVIDVNDENCKVINQFTSEKFKNMIELARNYYSKGYLGDISRALVQSKELVYLASTWKPGGSQEESLSRGANLINIPIGESYTYNSWLLNSLNAISRTSKHPLRALKFLELLYSDKEVYNLLTYGVENVHYTKVDDNVIKTKENSGYTSLSGWEFGNQFNAYTLEGQDPNIWQETKQINKTAKKSPLVGFHFDPTPVKLEIINCNSVYNEYIDTFRNGAYLDRTNLKYQEFINKMSAAGAEAIIKEKQKQIDKWLGK